MIKKMSKIEIIGSKSLLTNTIELLHSLGIVHIESIPERIGIEERFLKRIPLDEEKTLLKRQLEDTIERLKNISLLLPEPKVTRLREGMTLMEPLSEDSLGMVEEMERQVRALHKEKVELQRELSMVSKYERLLKGFAPFITRLKHFKFFETIGITIEKDKKGVVPLLKEELERITEGSYELFLKEIDEETLGIVLTYPKEYDTQIHSLLVDEGISEIKLPRDYEDLPIFEALRRMMVRRERLPQELLRVEKTLQSLSDMWSYKMSQWIDILTSLKEEIETIHYCAQTRYTFIISGWVPSDTIPLLSRCFKEDLEDKVMLRELEVKEEEMDEVPVYIKNPKYIEPFEVFMSILPPPKYGSIDPTPYIAIFFPTFFGLILGDIGYGTVLLILSLFLRKRFKGRDVFEKILTVIAISSVSSIIFGILFGEFFGTLGERFGLHPLLFDRMKAIKAFLVLSIAIGIGHVFLGIFLALINYVQRKKRKEALGKVVSIIVVATVFGLVAIMTEYLPRALLTPGVILIIVLLPVLIILEGAIAPIEILKTLSSILSYARIMAIGTSSVVLAIVANRIGGMTENLLLGIILAVVVHVLNTILGVFSPTIHSLRLHYVEFFSKFYKPGGRRYTPFKKRKLTID